VYSSDTIHARVTVEAILPSRSKPDRGTVRFRYRTFNQNDVEVLSLTMDHVMARRKGSETS
jgi:acyl dehydratase